MATRAEVVRLQRALNSISGLARADLARVWRKLPTNSAEATRDALLDLVPALVTTYGDPAAAVAAEWYGEVRASSSATGSHATVLASPTSQDAIAARVRFGVAGLFADDAAATFRFMNGLVEEQVKQPARATVAANVTTDRARPRYARVPSGAETCAFCLMLASRGAVYGGEEDAAFRGDGLRYHSDCDCVPTPIWSGDPLPDGYDPDALYDKYAQARDAVTGAPTETSVLSELRFQQGTN